MADKINSELNKICNEEFVPHFVGIKDEDLKMNKYQIGGIARNLKKDFVYIVDGGYKGLAGKVDLVSSFTEIDVEDLLSDSTDYFNSNSIVGSNKELYEKYTQKKKEKVEVEEKLQYLEQIVYFLENSRTKDLMMEDLWKYHPDVFLNINLGEKISSLSDGKVVDVCKYVSDKSVRVIQTPPSKSKKTTILD